MLAGGLIMLTVVGRGRRIQSPELDASRTAAAVVYLFFAGSLIGFVAYTYALAHLPMSVVSLYPYVNPVVAVLLGTWLLHEPLSWRIAAPSPSSLAGSAVVSRTTPPHAETARRDRQVARCG